MPTSPAYTETSSKINIELITNKKHTATPGDASDITKFEAWYQESKDLRLQHDERWAKNIKLLRGIFPDDELARSKVRKRSKIFFRKIWASNWRLYASMYEAFLREQDQFQIVGRNGDDDEDEMKAELLQIMTRYRVDLMDRTEDLFMQQMWAIMTMLDLGFSCAKFGWKYRKDKEGKVLDDKPDFILYPNEQVFPDMRATLPHRMRYIIFENYMSAEDVEEAGWTTDGMETYGPDSNVVRNARFQNGPQDPQNYSDSNTNQTYPKPGSGGTNENKPMRSTYCVKEIFYRCEGKVIQATWSGTKMCEPKKDSPYGNRIPAVIGQCLTLAHQLMGEGFPEPQEGPQESLNTTLNQRKDNTSILINGESLVDRYANVDLEALRTSRPANVILTDNPDAVKPLLKQDSTQNAYMEAGADASMMDEVSGVTPGLSGMDKSQKATTSQINFQNAGAKVNLFIGIVAQTWFRNFFTQLAYMIQRFETDETVFRVANKKMKKARAENGKTVPIKDIDTIDDFIADVDVKVAPDMQTQEAQARNLMLAMDRALMSNQATVPLVQAGVVPKEGVVLFNISAFMEPILKTLQQKNINKFIYKIPKQDIPPPAPPGGGAGQNKGMAGANAPQAETPDVMATAAQAIQGGASNA